MYADDQWWSVEFAHPTTGRTEFRHFEEAWEFEVWMAVYGRRVRSLSTPDGYRLPAGTPGWEHNPPTNPSR